jgi:hypothetical protein
MRNPLRSLFASGATVVAAALLASAPHAQTQGVWFSLQNATASPLRQQIERLVTGLLGVSYTPGTSATLSNVLASRAPTDLTFIAGRADEIDTFVRNDRFQQVERLKLEVINARLGATPFYLFTNGAKASGLRQAGRPARVLYASRGRVLQAADVQRLIGRMLGTQPTVSAPLNSPDELARRLFADPATGGVDVVGIYDAEPSPFLHDFLRAYDAERSAVGAPAGNQPLIQMLMFSTGTTEPDRDRLQVDRLQPVQGVSYALVRFDDMAIESLSNIGPAQKDGILAVSSADTDAAADALWVLSNVRSVSGVEAKQRLHRLLGDAYFAALMTSDGFQRRCESGYLGQYGAYLLDAQVGDRENVAKALAFWSDLVLRSTAGRPADLARLSDQRNLFETVLRERLNVQLNTKDGRESLVSRLRGGRATAREQFSDADGTLFQNAIQDIQAGLQSSDRGVRSKQLASGRAKLVALVEKGSGPACRGKDLGLFGRGLDPFFYLGLVDAYGALDAVAP